MRSRTTVGVDNNFSARQARISMRTADHKSPGGIDVIDDFLVEKICGNHSLNNFRLDRVYDLVLRNMGFMLGRNNHRVNARRFAVESIFNRNLGLAVRPQPFDLTRLAKLRKLARNPMGQRNRKRHLFCRLIARVPKHHALVSRTDFGVGLSHTLANVATLFVDRIQNGARLSIKAFAGVHVADVPYGLANDRLKVMRGLFLNMHFTGNQHETRRHQRFASHKSTWLVSQKGIENGVADKISNLIGMSLGDRLRAKKIGALARHISGF